MTIKQISIFTTALIVVLFTAYMGGVDLLERGHDAAITWLMALLAGFITVAIAAISGLLDN